MKLYGTDANSKEFKVTDKLLDSVKYQYEQFKLRNSLMGIDMSFKYKIQGKDVILEKYLGTTKHVIVPKFITKIGIGAFLAQGIKSVKLSDGLTAIDTLAFMDNDIEEIVVPKTVYTIGKFALAGNMRLFKINENKEYEIDTDRVKLLGPTPFMEKQMAKTTDYYK